MSEVVDTVDHTVKTEMPASMQPAKATKRTKTPVEVFNGSSSKLAKLGGLIDYVGERIEGSDFIVCLAAGVRAEVPKLSPPNLR